MARREEFLARMRDALAVEDPTIDSSAGTTVFKILETVSEQLAGVYGDGVLLDYHLDIDNKGGPELDNFVDLWGFKRFLGKRATGTVTFSRGTPAATNYIIPVGAQVYKPAIGSTPPIYFTTTAAGVLTVGNMSVEVPVEAVVAGQEGNVSSGAITLPGEAIEGITTVINPGPMLGGRDQETDEELRARWKATKFRSIAGTEDQFLALCYNEEAVTRALVVGPVERWREQLQIAGGTVTSLIPATESKYTYPPGGEFFGLDIGTPRQALGSRGVDYNMSTAVPPIVTILDAIKYPNGMVVDFEHEYTPAPSRNNPATGITDKVDIFVGGEHVDEFTEEVRMNRAFTFDDAGGANDRDLWLREDSLTKPTVGNFFTKLMKTPLISLADTMSILGVTYVEGIDYWLVHDVTTNKYSSRANDGIEWLSTNAPASNDLMIITYFYNALIERLHEQINLVRLIGIDTLVHRADYLFLRFNLAIMTSPGAILSIVQSDIESALTTWLGGKGFKDNVQVADVIDVVAGIDGVDNVRLLNNTEDADEIQTATITATGGQYRIRVKAHPDDPGELTADLAHNANAATVQAALEALAAVQAGDIVVAGTGATRTFTFTGVRWGNRPVPMLEIVNGTAPLSGGTITVVETTPGLGYGIQFIAEDDKTITATKTTDFYLESDTIPILFDVTVQLKAVNTW